MQKPLHENLRQNLGQILLLASFLALIDQLSKYFVKNYLQGSPTGGSAVLKYTENVDIAFGLPITSLLPIPHIILPLLTILLILLVIYIAAKELNLNHKLSKIAIALIIGGALGNLIDRLAQGFVVDFINISIGPNFSWPSFNLADSFITVGVLLTVIFYVKMRHDARR